MLCADRLAMLLYVLASSSQVIFWLISLACGGTIKPDTNLLAGEVHLVLSGLLKLLSPDKNQALCSVPSKAVTTHEKNRVPPTVET